MSLQSIYCIRHCVLRISYAFWSSLISIELPCRADLTSSPFNSSLSTTTLIQVLYNWLDSSVLVVPMVVNPLTRSGGGVLPTSLPQLRGCNSPRAEKRDEQMMEIECTEHSQVVIVVSLLFGLQLMSYANTNGRKYDYAS